MTETQLQNLIEINEIQTTEFKKSTGVAGQICETICAFANTDGGVILVGINPDRTSSKVEFTDNSQTDITDLFCSFDPALTSLVSIKKVAFRGYFVLLIEVKKSRIDYNCYRNDCYQRIGASNQKLTKEEYHQKRLTQNTVDWSGQVCESATLDDLDTAAIDSMRKILARVKNQEYQTLETTNLLNRVDLLKDGRPNNSCMLFLGKSEFTNQNLRDRNKISWVYRDEANGIEERLNIDEICKPFILLLPIVQKQIDRFNTYLQDLDIFREDIRQYDPKAVEEILVNAIAHRDWTIPLWVEVVQTPISLEIRNPGKFNASWDRIIEYNEKPPYKNPNLVSFLNHVGLMEREGNGIAKVYKTQITKGLELTLRSEAKDRVDLILSGKIKNIEFAKFILNRKNDIGVCELRVLEKISQGQIIIGKNITQKEFDLVENLVEVSKRGGHIKIKKHILESGGIYEKQFATSHSNGKTTRQIIQDFADQNKSGFTTSQIYDVLNGKNKALIRNILSLMVKNNEIRRISYGLYACYIKK